MKIKVLFPPREYIKDYRPAYYDYLFYGFSALDDVEVIEDPKLLKESFREPSKTIIAMNIIIEDNTTRVYYDWSDFQRFVYPELINDGCLYYKVECTQGWLERFNIQPIGQSVTDYHKFINNLDRFRSLKNSKNYDHDVFGIFRATSPKPGVKSLRIDCADIINKMNINHYVKVQPCNYRPVPGKEVLIQKKLNYVEFLEKTAKSKINLLLPGIGEYTWRISETLGIGCCAIMPKITSIFPGNPQNCWIEVERDLSDLEEKLLYYLNHDEEREQIAQNGLNYYENWLSPSAQAKNILQGVLNAKRKTNCKIWRRKITSSI